MRIISAGIQHETNTFANTPTTRADFASDTNCPDTFPGGDYIRQRFGGTGTIHGGYLQAAADLGVELVPLLNAGAQPSGVVRQADFEHLMDLLLRRLAEAGPADGIVLDLHGAMVTEEHQDAEGVIIQRVRDAVGPQVPIIATLDLHANISPEMASAANGLIGFDTYPHVDMYERGYEAVQLMVRTLRGEVRLAQAYRQLPLITLPPMQCTLREPMQSLMAKVHALEAEPGILTATVAMGFPFADIRDAGVSVLVTANGDQELAEHAADRLADMLWELRDALQPDLMPVDKLIEFVQTNNDGLVIYADGSDNPGGGAPADGTVILRALIEAGVKDACVGIIHDPETAAQAHQAGVGKTIRVRLGGKTDDRHGEPIEADAYVRCLADGRFVHSGPMRHGLEGNLGPTALLIVGGVQVVVISNRTQLLDTQQIRIVGVTPERLKLLVVKSCVHFRADLGPLAAHIFDADTPGIHRPDFSCFDYTRLRRPIYPLDQISRRDEV